MINNITTNQVKLYRNSIHRVIYFTLCLLLIGLYLSCAGEKSSDGGTSPIINYDSLGISSFSVVDSNDVPISNTNAIPLDISFSFLLTFDQPLGDMANYVNSLANQITLTGNRISPLPLKVEPTQTDNQVKITSKIYLGGDITYQLTLKKGLIIDNYQITNDITYLITTEKSSDSSLIVIYNNQEIFPTGNDITILLPIGSDPSSVSFILEVGEGASLQEDNNNNLSLNENNQYSTNMDFSGSATHSFTVTAQDGITSTIYTVGVLPQQMYSKEIISFAFRETDNSHLKANIAMDVNTNSRTVTKTVTNVEGITGLIPYIVHSGSNISPASGVAQDFSTDNTYTVTAIDKSMADYTVTLASYYGTTFYANGGLINGEITAIEYVLYGEKTTPPSDPSQEHYGFNGWYDAPNGGNTFNFDTPITTQTTVYAQWINKQYRVSFDTAGGTAISPVMVESLAPVDRPIDPTTNHYVFEGWYIDSSFTTRYDFNWTVSNDLTLYAKYINKQYQIRFYQGNDLLETILVTSLDLISASDYPTPTVPKQLYRWYSDSGLVNVYDKNSVVVDNLDLYAKVLTTDGTFRSIIENGVIPSDLVNYDDISKTIFSHYIAGADVMTRYVKETTSGTGDGSFWNNASGDIQAVVDGINDASENKIYMVLVASGTYKPSDSYVMKNHVALAGGFTARNYRDYSQSGETRLDGNNDKGVFNNDNNGLDRTALLYGVVITNGNNSGNGGGMNNRNSSPTLINVTFSDNEAINGGGMYSFSSFSTLINVTFLGNTADDNNGKGGGMYNNNSSPVLINTAFSDNTAVDDGGGMGNQLSSPTLINVTFSGNTADNGGIAQELSEGGGMYNNIFSSPVLINVTFSDNKADFGGGMYSEFSSSPTLINVTFSGNTAGHGGGGIYHDGNRPLTLINTILWNNDNRNIYLNNNDSSTKAVNLYYSLIEGGTTPSITATGIHLRNADTGTYPINIDIESVINNNPGLGNLADNGGEVATISIGNTSPAKDKGVYVRGVKSDTGNPYPETNLYYSENNTDWYSDPGLTTQESPPSDADDLTATDARGYSRVGRPDMGAYEEGGAAP